jgi:isocitrate dehydrogenase
MVAQTTDTKLAAVFKPIAEQLTANEEKIVSELLAVQGKPVDIGGHSFLSGIAL